MRRVQEMTRKLWFVLCVAVLAAGQALPAAAQDTAAPAVTVGTVPAKLQSIAKTMDFVGRVKAIQRVDITARVKGYLQSVLFKEGDAVKEGDQLYQIEPDEYQTAVKQAQGAVEQGQAALTLAVLQAKRAAELYAKNTGTEVARDQTVAEVARAKGSIIIDQANLAAANLNLSYTQIASPISGRISLTNVTKGNVVGPDSGVLTTIVSLDPIHVQFPVSQREFLKAQESGKPVDTGTIKVLIRFADGSEYPFPGRIDFIDVKVDTGTDTVIARAVLPNPNGVLVDGQFVSVVLESGTSQEKIVVPQSALLADQAGTYVFVVVDGKAVQKRVKLGGDSGTNSIVTEGLAEGDLVIVEGLQAVRPNAPVTAQPLPTSLDPS